MDTATLTGLGIHRKIRGSSDRIRQQKCAKSQTDIQTGGTEPDEIVRFLMFFDRET